MSSYARYKQWWMKHQAPHEIPSLYYGDTPESAFKQHIKDMSLYKLMETLEAWEEEEVPVQEERDIIDMWDNMVEKIKQQPWHSPMEQTPSFPRPHIPYNPLLPTTWHSPMEQTPSFPRPHIPYDPLSPTTWQKPQCPKCGMYLDKVMGYVCGDNHCPTFMKVTC